MAITANRDVLCCIYDQDGDPVQNAVVSFTLSAFDVDARCFVTIEEITGTTDASGEATISVWPNTAGENGTHYIVTATDSGGTQLLNGLAVVADVDNQQLTDILVDTVTTDQVVNRRNLTLFAGQAFEGEFTFTQPDGTAPILGGYTLVMKVWDSPGGTLQFDSSVDSGFTLTGVGDTLTLELTSTRVDSITSGWYYEISADDGSDEFVLVYGTLYKQP